jgi:hypothetical protein
VLFESRDGQPITARYGDSSLAAPLYDVEAARELLAKQQAVAARWSGASTAMAPGTPRDTAVSFEGAMLDASDFRFRRDVTTAPAGLTLLPLDSDVLSRSNELRDIRLVDSAGKQIPYVMERRGAPLVERLVVPARASRERNVSVYDVRFPLAAPSGSRLVLSTGSRVFSRRVELIQPEDASRGIDEQLMTSATWRSGDASEAAAPLTFEIPPGTRSIQLRVDEGDNAPLPIASAELQMPAYALRFFSPGTPLQLVYGNAAAAAPDYDIALLAPRLFSEAARETSLAKPRAIATEDEPPNERRFFWVAITIVVLVLLVLVARLLAPLVREEPRPLP